MVACGSTRGDPSAAFSTCARRASRQDRKSTRLNSSHSQISYAVFCLKKKKTHDQRSVDLANPLFATYSFSTSFRPQGRNAVCTHSNSRGTGSRHSSVPRLVQGTHMLS